jgi:hypothetical protein
MLRAGALSISAQEATIKLLRRLHPSSQRSQSYSQNLNDAT